MREDGREWRPNHPWSQHDLRQLYPQASSDAFLQRTRRAWRRRCRALRRIASSIRWRHPTRPSSARHANCCQALRPARQVIVSEHRGGRRWADTTRYKGATGSILQIGRHQQILTCKYCSVMSFVKCPPSRGRTSSVRIPSANVTNPRIGLPSTCPKQHLSVLRTAGRLGTAGRL